MAFDPTSLSTLVQTLGGGHLRIYVYATSDSIEDIDDTDYFIGVAQYGVQVGDIILAVAGDSATEVFSVIAVDADGNATCERTSDPLVPVIATGGTVARSLGDHVGIRATLSNYLGAGVTHAEAFNLAAAWLKTRGGGVLDLEGKAWVFDGVSLLVDGSYIVIDATGAFCTCNYTGGPSLVFGSGTAQLIENGIKGGRWIQNASVDQPLLELRWQRGFNIGARFYTNQLHSFLRWGRVSDGLSKPCSQLTISHGVEVNQRNTGTASHGIDVLNSVGALYCFGKFEGPTNDEGVLTGFGTGAAFLHFEATNPQARFDYGVLNDGIAKGYDYGIDDSVYRVVNIEIGSGWRFDNCGTAGIKIGDAATAGAGVEAWNINCKFGGFTLGRHVDIVANTASGQIASIKVNSVTNRGTLEAVSITTVGASIVRGLRLALEAYNWIPESAAVRLVAISGDVNGVVQSVHLKQEGGTNPDVLLEDTPPATSELSIFRVTAERAPNTAYVLRTNAGTTALRWTETGADGLPTFTSYSGTYAGTLTFSGAVTFTGTHLVQLSDNGAGVGPDLHLRRISTSPAASDGLGRVIFEGRNDAAGTIFYANVSALIVDPAAGAEASTMTFGTYVAGALATRWMIQSGHLRAFADNTYDIGNNGSLRPRNFFLAGDMYVGGNIGLGGTAPSPTTFAVIPAGTTAKSQMRFVASVAPTTPADGDVWFDGTALKIRIGGVTKTFTVT